MDNDTRVGVDSGVIGDDGVEVEAGEWVDAAGDAGDEETGVVGEVAAGDGVAFLPNEKKWDTPLPPLRVSTAAAFCCSMDEMTWRGAGVMDTRAAEARAG